MDSVLLGSISNAAAQAVFHAVWGFLQEYSSAGKVSSSVSFIQPGKSSHSTYVNCAAASIEGNAIWVAGDDKRVREELAGAALFKNADVLHPVNANRQSSENRDGKLMWFIMLEALLALCLLLILVAWTLSNNSHEKGSQLKEKSPKQSSEDAGGKNKLL